MRLLITGAAGFMGHNALLATPRSWHIVALYRPGTSDFLRFIASNRLHNVQAVACDLTDKCQVEQAIDQVGSSFDSCLALASNTSIPASVAQPVEDLTTNVIGLLHLLQCCTFEHLVYLSSGAVYVGLSGLVGPASAVCPDLPYAISKLAAEQYIRAFMHHQHTPKRATIIRFFGAYGPYEPARKLYTRLVRRFAFEHNSSFTVTGDGENYIDAMYVDDTMRALLAVLTSASEDEFRCLDLGVGGRETVNQVVTRVAHTFGLEPEIKHEGVTTEYINFMIDPQPFSTAYHFTPTISLEDGIQRLASHLAQTESMKEAR